MDYDRLMNRLQGQIARWLMTDQVDLEVTDEAPGPMGAPTQSYTVAQAGMRCRIEPGQPRKELVADRFRTLSVGKAIFIDPIAAGVTNRLTIHAEGKPDRHLFVEGTKDIQDRGKVFIVTWKEYPPAN